MQASMHASMDVRMYIYIHTDYIPIDFHLSMRYTNYPSCVKKINHNSYPKYMCICSVCLCIYGCVTWHHDTHYALNGYESKTVIPRVENTNLWWEFPHSIGTIPWINGALSHIIFMKGVGLCPILHTCQPPKIPGPPVTPELIADSSFFSATSAASRAWTKPGEIHGNPNTWTKIHRGIDGISTKHT